MLQRKRVNTTVPGFTTSAYRDSALIPLVQPVRLWAVRSSELVSLVSLVTFAMKQQLATGRLSTPKLVGEAMADRAIVGAGFLGFGSAAPSIPGVRVDY